jgi:chromodomain-helicase-DNA-binding protein 4
MAAPDQVSDSEASEVDLITTPSRDQDRVLSQPESVLSHRFRDSPRKLSDQQTKEGSSAAAENKIAVMVSAPSRPWEYQPYRGATTVDAVLKEIKKPGGALWYKIEYEDGKKEDVSPYIS